MSPTAKEVKQTAHLVIVPESTRCIGAYRALAIYQNTVDLAFAICPRLQTLSSHGRKRGNVSETQRVFLHRLTVM
ncbi:hypothetical protein BDZ89DRAFT_1064151, partial [Hymenopellis radicata]